MRYENITLFLAIIYITTDIIKVIYNVMFQFACFTWLGIITTIIESILLYNMIKRFNYIINMDKKREDNRTTSKSSVSSKMSR